MKQTYKPRHKIADLTEHPENPNVGDVDAITESLDTLGFYGAVLVQESSGYIIAGNHRTRAAKQRGDTTVPVILLDVDDDTARRIMLGDNRIAALAHTDDTLLAELLADVAAADLGLSATGYNAADLAALVADLDTSGFAPVDEDDQPRLDQRAASECPSCGFCWRVAAGGEIEPA